VPEDPVTGSMHAALTPFWAKRLGKKQLRAYQASARGGDLLCTDEGEQVILSGPCALYLRGHRPGMDEQMVPKREAAYLELVRSQQLGGAGLAGFLMALLGIGTVEREIVAALLHTAADTNRLRQLERASDIELLEARAVAVRTLAGVVDDPAIAQYRDSSPTTTLSNRDTSMRSASDGVRMTAMSQAPSAKPPLGVLVRTNCNVTSGYRWAQRRWNSTVCAPMVAQACPIRSRPAPPLASRARSSISARTRRPLASTRSPAAVSTT